MRQRQRQRGMTAIGFIIIAALVGLVGYGAVRLVPVYMTQMQIRQLLADLKTEYDGNAASIARLQTEIGNRLNIDAVTYPTRQDFVITKTEDGLMVSVDYEDSVPYIGNLSLSATFENSVEIRR
jgi:cell division protein FtsB